MLTISTLDEHWKHVKCKRNLRFARQIHLAWACARVLVKWRLIRLIRLLVSSALSNYDVSSDWAMIISLAMMTYDLSPLN